jgi:hypothetical protein
MITAALRQRDSINSAPPHHRANQNIGWVMADNNFEKKNIESVPIYIGVIRNILIADQEQPVGKYRFG